jgi:hypothetical protein
MLIVRHSVRYVEKKNSECLLGIMVFDNTECVIPSLRLVVCGFGVSGRVVQLVSG